MKSDIIKAQQIATEVDVLFKQGLIQHKEGGGYEQSTPQQTPKKIFPQVLVEYQQNDQIDPKDRRKAQNFGLQTAEKENEKDFGDDEEY